MEQTNTTRELAGLRRVPSNILGGLQPPAGAPASDVSAATGLGGVDGALDWAKRNWGWIIVAIAVAVAIWYFVFRKR